MLPRVLGDICAYYVGLHEVEILTNAFYTLVLPFTSNLEKQIHPFHADMKYASIEWIPSVLSVLTKRQVKNPVGHLYFFARWYGNQEVEKNLLQVEGMNLNKYRLISAVAVNEVQSEDIDLFIETFMNIDPSLLFIEGRAGIRAKVLADLIKKSVTWSSHLKKSNLQEIERILNKVENFSLEKYSESLFLH
jgi:hypothetical protein